MRKLKTISISLLAIIAMTLVSCMQEENPKEAKQQKGPQHTEDFWVKNWLRSEVFYYHVRAIRWSTRRPRMPNSWWRGHPLTAPSW